MTSTTAAPPITYKEAYQIGEQLAWQVPVFLATQLTAQQVGAAARDFIAEFGYVDHLATVAWRAMTVASERGFKDAPADRAVGVEQPQAAAQVYHPYTERRPRVQDGQVLRNLFTPSGHFMGQAFEGDLATHIDRSHAEALAAEALDRQVLGGADRWDGHPGHTAQLLRDPQHRIPSDD